MVMNIGLRPTMEVLPLFQMFTDPRGFLPIPLLASRLYSSMRQTPRLRPCTSAGNQIMQMLDRNVIQLFLRTWLIRHDNCLQDGAALTVEAHVLHRFSSSFYGEPLRVIATGFLRHVIWLCLGQGWGRVG